MAISVHGVVARGKGEAVEVTEVLVPEPGPGEALVRVQACGVCHTDLHYKMGGIGDDFPYLLGHEAAGVVEAVGDDVTDVAPGDFVILNWRAVCGQCRACKRGRPWYCFATHNATQKMTLADGTPLSPALGIGAFAEKTLVAAGQCTKVNPAIAPATAGLLGCGVMAGLGAAINTAGVGRGDTVAVIGCGGVGLSAVNGAALAGAERIIAIDRVPSKLELAREMGATDTINASNIDAVEAVRDLTRGGVHYSFEALGTKATAEQTFQMLRPGGTATIIGMVPFGIKIELHGYDFLRDRKIQGTSMGGNRFRVDMPRLLSLWRQGRLKLDHLISGRIQLNEINEGFAALKSAAPVRQLIDFGA
jgi:S-(hydroxymethyl)mycothiol dehydrogenase